MSDSGMGRGRAGEEEKGVPQASHLAEHTATNPQPTGVSFPSQEPFGICCPCVHANPSSKMDSRKRAGTLMVPANLSLNTLREVLL